MEGKRAEISAAESGDVLHARGETALPYLDPDHSDAGSNYEVAEVQTKRTPAGELQVRAETAQIQTPRKRTAPGRSFGCQRDRVGSLLIEQRSPERQPSPQYPTPVTSTSMSLRNQFSTGYESHTFYGPR